MPGTDGPPPGAMVMQLLMSRWVAQAISAFAKAGVADHMGDEPTGIEAIAAASSLHAGSLYRVCRLLEMVGLVSETAPRAFALTPVGRTLRSDAPDSMRDVAIFFGEEIHVRAWSRLEHCLRTGEPGLDQITGMPGFQYLRENPDVGEVFNRAMTSFTRQEAHAVLATYDFDGVSTLADVGGGHGLMLGLILSAHPEMTGVLFDLPHVVADAPPTLRSLGVLDRVQIAAGSFFEDPIPAADACLMKHIIHDWNDDDSVKILAACRAAVKDGGKVLLAEMIIPPGPAPHPGKALDVEMLVVTQGGRERSEAEYRALMERAGLELARIVPTMGPMAILEGVRR